MRIAIFGAGAVGGHLAAKLAAAGNDVAEPGVVMNHTPGDNMVVVGELDDRPSERISRIRLTLEQSGISSPAAADVRQVVWSKLVLNMGTGTLCLLTGASVGEAR